uniref:Major facilitator superfamily (MFS) profile domain-containing protein n=1 Tax=Panagrolaimus davidi TaxID=227884 RepID=A0A914QZK4_9BILA
MGDTVKLPFTSIVLKRSVFIAYVLSTIHNVAFFTQMMGLPYIAKRNGISDAAFGYSQTFFGNIYGLFISRIFGILIHGVQGHQAMIAAVTEPGKERTTAFGKIGVCFGISFVIAPIINKVAGLFFRDSASLFSAMILSFVGVYVAHKYVNDNEFASYKDDKENKEESKVSFKKVIKIAKEPNVLTVFLQKNIAVAPMHIPFAVMQLYLIEKFGVTEGENSTIQIAIGLLIMIANGFGISYLRNKFAEEKLIHLGAISLLLVHAQFSYFVYFYQLYFILPFLAIGMTLVNTVSDSILTASVEQNEQAIILGICTAFASFFRTLAPSIGGLIMDKYGFSLIGYIGVSCALLSLSIGFLFPIKNFKSSDVVKKDT